MILIGAPVSPPFRSFSIALIHLSRSLSYTSIALIGPNHSDPAQYMRACVGFPGHVVLIRLDACDPAQSMPLLAFPGTSSSLTFASIPLIPLILCLHRLLSCEHGIDLRVPAFAHGQIYVAFSRGKSYKSAKCILNEDTKPCTKNVVYKEAIV